MDSSASSPGSFDTTVVDYQASLVPSCDIILNISGAGVNKTEVLGLTHHLGIQGWQGIPLAEAMCIQLEALNGALTNAVYLMSSPRQDFCRETDWNLPKLVVRIFKPEVESLVDRRKEEEILYRLSRENFGPRVLGIFSNGRFEEYLESQTLTSSDLRESATSQCIARLIRGLHDSIELLDEERRQGPSVWLNWDNWAAQCERKMSDIDHEVAVHGPLDTGPQTFVCGVEWKSFRKTVDKYRDWLTKEHKGGRSGISESLVLAHNDIQYGNLLRLTSDSSHPGRLVLIDFEYASANTPSCEIANHFAEWCYNYRDPVKPWACNTTHYPTLEEQRSFVSCYISNGTKWKTDCRTNKTGRDEQVEKLLMEIRLWRAANSAEWIAWALTQAKHPQVNVRRRPSSSTESKDKGQQNYNGGAGLSCLMGHIDGTTQGLWDTTGGFTEESATLGWGNGAGADFDYLAYAHDRALFFWGDLVSLDFINQEDLPETLVNNIKIVR